MFRVRELVLTSTSTSTSATPSSTTILLRQTRPTAARSRSCSLPTMSSRSSLLSTAISSADGWRLHGLTASSSPLSAHRVPQRSALTMRSRMTSAPFRDGRATRPARRACRPATHASGSAPSPGASDIQIGGPSEAARVSPRLTRASGCLQWSRLRPRNFLALPVPQPTRAQLAGCIQ